MAEQKPKNILIIEDDEEVQELLNASLVQEGYRTMRTGNGSEALKLIKDNSFDLAVMDMFIPGKSGFEIIKSLQTDHMNLPILVITGKYDSSALLNMIEFEANVKDYVLKPIDMSLFIARVNKILSASGRADDKKKESAEDLFFKSLADTVKSSKIRKYQRLPVVISVDTFIADLDVKKGTGHVIDFSEGGVALLSETDIAVDIELNIKSTAATLELGFYGRIVRKNKIDTKKNLYGIQFTRMDDSQRKKVKEHIKIWFDLQNKQKQA